MKGTRIRVAWLRLLHRIGLKSFVSKAGGRPKFVCHLGDFLGEIPFYNFGAFGKEIAVMQSWCADIDQPLILDVGAHVGFVAVQLAQGLLHQNPRILCFEPVPSTYMKLDLSVRTLDLQQFIVPVPCAISNRGGLVTMAHDEWNSMRSQVIRDYPRNHTSSRVYAAAVTLDAITQTVTATPTLLKVDVEGYESKVFSGGSTLLSSESRPGIFFELNPTRLTESGSNNEELQNCLPGYKFYYVNSWSDTDFSRFGKPLDRLEDVTWDCDVFAVPNSIAAIKRWNTVVSSVRARFA